MKFTLRLLGIILSRTLASSETVLWDFNPANGDPRFPYYNFLSSDNAGNLYGVTGSGGAYGGGAAFKLAPNGKGGWTRTVVYTFPNDGSSWPIGGLALDTEGNLYGVSAQGGSE